MLRLNPAKSVLMAALALFFLLGCASKEAVYRSVYDGLQKREEIVHPGNGPAAGAATSYDAYRRERAESLDPAE